MHKPILLLLLLSTLTACDKEHPPSAVASTTSGSIPMVNISITDDACQPMSLTVKQGKTQFIIKNKSRRAVEWEILQGVYVIEERENIAPGFSQKLTAKLAPGRYAMTCGLLSNPHGELIVE